MIMLLFFVLCNLQSTWQVVNSSLMMTHEVTRANERLSNKKTELGWGGHTGGSVGG